MIVTLDIKAVLLLVFTLGFFITYLTIPSILGIALSKKLTDNPNNRSAHSKETPTLGGISFFFTLMTSFFFLHRWDSDDVTVTLVAGITILFVIGLKDDLVSISPFTKFMAQIITAIFLISESTLSVGSLNGFMEIYELPSLISHALTIFIVIMIINSFNLIDGVDGLASIIGIIISLVYAIIFYYMKDYFYALLGVVMVSIFLAFLRYNLAVGKKKIFMGDTGSLIAGYIIAILTIHFLSVTSKELNNLPFKIENIPLIVLSILIVPLFDTTRVFSLRLLNRKSPFKPDKNHIHHILLKFGFSHRKITIMIGLFNLSFVLIFLILSNSLNYHSIVFIFILFSIILSILFFSIDFSYSNLKKKVRLKHFFNMFRKNNK